MESCCRWKDNGLPRKGWLFDDVEDLGEPLGECEWCGTKIRYVHYLYHSIVKDLETTCGCICAENLTEDYVNPRAKEKELKDEIKKKLKHKRKYMRKKFDIVTKNYNFGLRFENNVIIFCEHKNRKIQLFINGTWGKRFYDTHLEAREISYEYLYGDLKKIQST